MQESQVPLQKEEGYAKKHSPLPFVFFSSFQAPGLPVHILNHNIKNFAKAGAVFQNLPRLVGVEVDFYQFVVAHRQQAITSKVAGKIFIDGSSKFSPSISSWVSYLNSVISSPHLSASGVITGLPSASNSGVRPPP